jgi:hypothetical protein
MTTTCQRAILSLLECARFNAVKAREELKQGNRRMHDYRKQVARDCRRDAAALRNTAR